MLHQLIAERDKPAHAIKVENKLAVARSDKCKRYECTLMTVITVRIKIHGMRKEGIIRYKVKQIFQRACSSASWDPSLKSPFMRLPSIEISTVALDDNCT